MALNKLVHLVHGWALANGRGIVATGAEVWRYGPVYRDVYDAFQNFGHRPIGMAMPIAGTMHFPAVPAEDAWAWDVIRKVVHVYRNDDACALSEICHAIDSPWRRVAERHDFRVSIGTVIPEEDMLEHFRRMLSIDVGTRACAAA
jgi:uncharacterized phage-associated protein